MKDNLEEKKMSADGYSSIEDPVTPAGGEKADHKADLNKKVNPKAQSVKDGVTKVTKNAEKVVEACDEDDEDDDQDDDDKDVKESYDISDLFEGLDLSEDFKSKASLVFEAAVNEAALERANEITEHLEENLQEEFNTVLQESIDEIVENLDGYLDYVIAEWMEENALQVESGIKVEMAESLMDGLRTLFSEHNIDIDEETVDVVSGLEEELEEITETANKAINELLALEEELQAIKAERVFESMVEGLSTAQAERFKILSEKLDHSDLDAYAEDLGVLKESFFKKKSSSVISEDLDREGEALIEETVKTNQSPYADVNALAKALKNYK